MESNQRREQLEAIQKAFTRKLNSDTIAQGYRRQIQEGATDFVPANRYAERVGELLAETFREFLTDDTLSEEITEYVLTGVLQQDYELVTEATATVVETLNSKAGMGVKAVRPAIEIDRVEGIVRIAIEQETAQEAAQAAKEPVIGFSRHVADRVVEDNVEANFRAGLNPTVRRIAVNGCCEWCDSLEGEYKYPVRREVYRRHKNCRCLVLYDPGNGKVQNAHTKKQYESAKQAEQEAALEERKKALERAEGERQKVRSAQKVIRQRISSGKYNLKLKHQKYLQHIEGTAQYENATKGRGKPQSYLTISEKEAQNLIYNYAGLGTPQEGKKGEILDFEYVSTGKLVGYYHVNNEPIPTDRIAICYGESGSHIYPVKPV